MKQRQLLFGALVVAAAVQAVFVAVYHYATHGCFCAITSNRTPLEPFATRVFEVGSSPLRQLSELLSGLPQVGGWTAVVAFAVLNALFWTTGVWLLFNLVALAFRIRLSPSTGILPRFRLLSLADVRAAWFGGALALLGLLGLTASGTYRRWWIASAEEAVTTAVTSIRAGRPFYAVETFEVSCYDDCNPRRFARSVSFERHEQGLGTSFLDRLVAPVRLAGSLRVPDGVKGGQESDSSGAEESDS